MGLPSLGDAAAEEEEVHGILADDWTSGEEVKPQHPFLPPQQQRRQFPLHLPQRQLRGTVHSRDYDPHSLPYRDVSDDDDISHLESSYAASTAEISVAHSAAVTRKERRRRAEISIMSSRKGGNRMRGLNTSSSMLPGGRQSRGVAPFHSPDGPHRPEPDYKTSAGIGAARNQNFKSDTSGGDRFPVFIVHRGSTRQQSSGGHPGLSGGAGAFYPGGVDAASDFKGHFTPTSSPSTPTPHSSPSSLLPRSTSFTTALHSLPPTTTTTHL